MSEIVDLDTIMPQPCVIRFGEQEITVNPPRTIDYIQLGALTDKLNRLEGINDAQVQKIVDDITERIYICIPEIRGKSLNKAQLQLLVNIITTMANPPAPEADGKAVTRDSGPKDPQD